jgi:uncharacterized membrane protein YphA (DoxX/SURF4 family)
MPNFSIFSDPHVVLFCRFMLAGVMFTAGVGKILSQSKFDRILRVEFRFPLTPSRFIARWLPPTEIGLGVLLATGILVRIASALSLLLLATFFMLLVGMRLTGRLKVDCNCFGTNSGPKRVAGLIQRNSVLIALAILVYSQSGSLFLLWSGASGVQPTEIAATGLAAAGVFLFVYVFHGTKKVFTMRDEFRRQLHTAFMPTAGGNAEGDL